MYKSPIELITSDFQMNVGKTVDEHIYNAVINVGVNVDKSELLKALKYDREQYRKGYVNGVKKFAAKLQERKYKSSEWSHGEHPYVVEESDIDDILEEMVGDAE